MAPCQTPMLELDSVFSDGHSLITITLILSQKLAPSKTEQSISVKKQKLPKDKKILFVQN